MTTLKAPEVRGTLSLDEIEAAARGVLDVHLADPVNNGFMIKVSAVDILALCADLRACKEALAACRSALVFSIAIALIIFVYNTTR